MRELRCYAAGRPERQLRLERMVVRAVGVVPVVDSAELRVSNKEVLREQSTRAERATGNCLACGLHRADVRGVQKPRHCREIAVSNRRAERCMTPQRFRASNVSSDDSNSGAEIQPAQHLVEYI